jgi:hypothetical protein
VEVQGARSVTRKRGKRKAPPDVAGGTPQSFSRELQDIRGLLMLLLLKLGTSTDELGAALNVSGQRVRQLIAAGKIKKLRLPGGDDASNARN